MVQQFHGEKELFKSEHLDWCLAVTIEGKCHVHSLRAYQVSSHRWYNRPRLAPAGRAERHPSLTWPGVLDQALKKVELTDYFTRFTYKVCCHAACVRPFECNPWLQRHPS